MQVESSKRSVRSFAHDHGRAGRSVGVVPTMGALHEGHLSLIRAARAQCDAVIVTIFVNPTQFAPDEDLDNYPRTIDSDLDACRREGADLVFVPDRGEMYEPGFQTVVSVSRLTRILEGNCRPTHFDGVTTVVAKLLHVTLPDRAYFGQKDFQQQLVIRQMCRDLDWPTEIVTCPIVREPDGLAMSSRNRYLSAEERLAALVLSRSLKACEAMAADGRSPAEIEAVLRSSISAEPLAQPEYAVVVDRTTLEPSANSGAVVALVAARVGTTRLIDNTLLNCLAAE